MTIKDDIELVREWVGEDHGLGNYQDAIDAFERLVELIPLHPEIRDCEEIIFTPRNAQRGLSDEC